MNQDQLSSYIRSGLKIGGALLLAHGWQQAGGVAENLLNAPDIIGLLATGLGMLLSHFTHTSPPSDSGGGPAGKAFLVIAFASLFLTGCISSNPARLVITTSPAGIVTTNVDATAPAYIVMPSLTNNIATAATVASVAAPLAAAFIPAAAPAAPFVPSLVDWIGGLIVLVSGIFAGYKNRQANQQAAAAAALAATIPPASHAAALANAATNGSTAAVATALQASQSPT